MLNVLIVFCIALRSLLGAIAPPQSEPCHVYSGKNRQAPACVQCCTSIYSHSWASHTLARHLCSSRVDFRQKAVNPALRPQQHVKGMAGLPAQNLLAPSMGQSLVFVGTVVCHLFKTSQVHSLRQVVHTHLQTSLALQLL